MFLGLWPECHFSGNEVVSTDSDKKHCFVRIVTHVAGLDRNPRWVDNNSHRETYSVFYLQILLMQDQPQSRSQSSSF